METLEELKRRNQKLFSLLGRVATDQHERLLKRLLSALEPHLEGEPELLVMPSSLKQLEMLSERAVELEMRGKTPEPIDFGGYTLAAPLQGFPFHILYLTRPLTNKLLLTVLLDQPLRHPIALRLSLNPESQIPTSGAFDPRTALTASRIPAPPLPSSLPPDPQELISAALLLRESLETAILSPSAEENLRHQVPYPLEREVGLRFFPPLQVARTTEDLLRPEAHLLRLPTVPLLAAKAPGPASTLIQLETVPSWPPLWSPSQAQSARGGRVTLIGEGLDYDLTTLLRLMRDLSAALTTQKEKTGKEG